MADRSTEYSAIQPGVTHRSRLLPAPGTLEAIIAGDDGAVWAFQQGQSQPWRIDRIAAPGFSHAAQPLAAAYYRDHDTLEVLLVDSTGAVSVLWKSSNQGWRAAPITDSGIVQLMRSPFKVDSPDGWP